MATRIRYDVSICSSSEGRSLFLDGVDKTALFLAINEKGKPFECRRNNATVSERLFISYFILTGIS